VYSAAFYFVRFVHTFARAKSVLCALRRRTEYGINIDVPGWWNKSTERKATTDGQHRKKSWVGIAGGRWCWQAMLFGLCFLYF